MVSFSPSLRYYLFQPPTDMRKGYYGLSGLVREHMNRDPVDGSVYIFMNRTKEKIKLLVWDRTHTGPYRGGFVVYYKSLEAGTFELPPGNLLFILLE